MLVHFDEPVCVHFQQACACTLSLLDIITVVYNGVLPFLGDNSAALKLLVLRLELQAQHLAGHGWCCSETIPLYCGIASKAPA